METSQPISIESFSYSWLVNMKPSLEACVDASDEASSFIEMDPRNTPSKRFFQRNSQEFKFDFPVSQSPLALVHADELFSNGYLTPLVAESLKMESCGSDSVSSISNLVLPSSASSSSSINCMGPTIQASRCSSLKRCRTLSRRMFQKYLNFLRPLCRRLRGRHHQKSGSNHEGSGKRGFCETSPRISVAYSADDYWRKSCDSESSIYEAVLHCKRSIEKT